MAEFQLRSKPLGKIMANFRGLESRILPTLSQETSGITGWKNPFNFKTWQNLFFLWHHPVLLWKKIPVFHIFYPNDKLIVNCCVLKSRQGVSREGFWCSLTRIILNQFRCWFWYSKDLHHKIQKGLKGLKICTPQNVFRSSIKCKSCASFHPVQLGVGAGVLSPLFICRSTDKTWRTIFISLMWSFSSFFWKWQIYRQIWKYSPF